ncbi:hypothetical protein DERP_006510, partial [Dermatophagoides pteronyssinus]
MGSNNDNDSYPYCFTTKHHHQRRKRKLTTLNLNEGEESLNSDKNCTEKIEYRNSVHLTFYTQFTHSMSV